MTRWVPQGTGRVGRAETMRLERPREPADRMHMTRRSTATRHPILCAVMAAAAVGLGVFGIVTGAGLTVP